MVERLAPIIAAEPLTELWPTICSLSTRAQPARALVFDLAGAILAQASQQLRQSHLQSGWVEHDPMGIWSSPRHIAERAVQQGGSPHMTSGPSALPTSEKPLCCGKGLLGCRYTMPSSGDVGGAHHNASVLWYRALPPKFAAAQVW